MDGRAASSWASIIPLVSVVLAAAGPAQVGIVSPATSPDPYVNTAVVNADALGRPIARIKSIDWHHVAPGAYQLYLAVEFAGVPGGGYAVGGALILPNIWIPDLSLAQIPSTTIDSITVSPDHSVAVWHEGNGPGLHMCVRVPPMPFLPINIRVSPTVGSQPNIGEDLGGGRVSLFYADPLSGSILRGELDTATASVSSITVAVPFAGPAGGFYHSPSVLRDSTGKPRCMTFAYRPALIAGTSHVYFTEGVANDGTPELVVSGATTPPTYYSTPGLAGGSWRHCTNGPQPAQTEVTALANADLRSGSGRIAAFAPFRPFSSTSFLSVVGIGVPAPAYQIPPVLGDILIFPTIGLLNSAFHDGSTGLAEWSFVNVPPLNLTLSMQLITFDVARVAILAGNVATLRI